MSVIASGFLAASLALSAAGLTAIAPAAAGPLGAAPGATSRGDRVVLVGHRSKGWEGHGHRHRHRGYAYRGTYVRAPFTRVKTRGNRWTSVDAPFASVRVRPWGTWVRAPFVDIYVPR
jgi:hypothetical protein